jgi:hypothetical protein
MIVNGNDQRLSVATAMQMQQTGVQQALAPKYSQQHDTNSGSKGDSIQSLGGDTVSIKINVPQNTIDTLQQLGNTSDILNSLATNLRQTYEGLTSASAITEKMKSTLNTVIKDYPPYSVDDQGRMKQLMGYAGLRKQLQSLMIPSPPAPLYDKIQHLWEGLTGGAGGSVQTLSLPHDAPNTHVAAAAKQLDAVSSQISLVQESMVNLVMKG